MRVGAGHEKAREPGLLQRVAQGGQTRRALLGAGGLGEGLIHRAFLLMGVPGGCRGACGKLAQRRPECPELLRGTGGDLGRDLSNWRGGAAMLRYVNFGWGTCQGDDLR